MPLAGGDSQGIIFIEKSISMKIKPFKKEKLTNKQRLPIIIVGSLTIIFLLIAIYQSFAAYNIKHSERIVDAKVGSMYDIRALAIFIDGEPQPGMIDFPTDKEFDKVECFVDGKLVDDESIKGEWNNVDNSLSISGFTHKTDCNVYFVSTEEITVTFIANTATLSTPTGCTNSGNNRICRCTMRGNNPCEITSPTITGRQHAGHAPNNVIGFHTSEIEQTSQWNSNALNTVSANATYHAIHLRPTAYSITNLVQNGSFENGLTGWDFVGPFSTVPSPVRFGSRALRKEIRQPSDPWANILQNFNMIANNQYYSYLYGASTHVPNAVAVSVLLQSRVDTVIYPHIPLVGPNVWTRGSSIYTSPASGPGRINLAFNVNVAGPIFVDGVTIVNLTAAFGAGNEPPQAWGDRWLVDWFDGTSNTNNGVPVRWR